MRFNLKPKSVELLYSNRVSCIGPQKSLNRYYMEKLECVYYLSDGTRPREATTADICRAKQCVRGAKQARPQRSASTRRQPRQGHFPRRAGRGQRRCALVLY